MQFFPLVLLCVLLLRANGAEVRFDFADVSEGALPTNFVSVLAGGGPPARWQVIGADVPSAFQAFNTNRTLLTRARVLAQTSDDMTDERFPMCVYDGATFRDFKFSTQFKIAGGITEQMAGIVFRFLNASNFYVTRVSAAGHNLRFYKVVNGVRSEPVGVDLKLSAGEWHTLGVQCEGNHVTIFLDDRPALPVLGDNTFIEGRVGFWTKSDSVTYFNGGLVEFTPRLPPAQQLVNTILARQVKLLGLRIYTLQPDGTTKIIASKDTAEIGQPGTDDIRAAIQNNTVSYGRTHGAVDITLPVRDRNGDTIAAMRVKLKAFFGETQDIAVTRGLMVRNAIEQICTGTNDLGD